jgi:RimJ/RimL family protein N-acetyltransferase
MAIFLKFERVVSYGFDKMNLHSIEAVIDPSNATSEKFYKNVVLRKRLFY